MIRAAIATRTGGTSQSALSIKTSHYFTVGHNRIYPALSALKRDGLVVHKVVPSDRGPSAHSTTLVNKSKKKGQGCYAPALLPMVVGLLLGSPYLAIHLLKERLALLVALLVIAHQLQLIYRETVEALGDLIHVHIVVALYREYGRLRRPLSALDGGTRSGADRPGRGAQQARGRLREGAQPLPGAPCGLLGARPVAGEGVVEELRVGLDGLPRQRLPGLLLPAYLLGELLSVCAAGL